MNMTEAIKKAIKQSGKSIHSIAVQSGVTHPSIFNFLSGKRGLKLDTADKLASYLKIEVRIEKTKTSVKKKRKRTARKRTSSKRS